jgi:tubulin polyglutamylase TTLL6/13
MRLYVLVLSLDPLRVFLCREGLVRVCSEVYEAPTARNAARVTAHLTNYTLNKAAPKFEHVDDPADGARGSKRCMSVVLEHMHRTGLVDRGELWEDLKRLLADCTVAMAAAMRGALLPSCISCTLAQGFEG